MKKSYIVDNTYNDVRLDKWIKKNISDIPQSLIEKNIRKGNIKINNIKEKSSYKLKKNDQVILYNFSFLSGKNKKKTTIYKPTKKDLSFSSSIIIIPFNFIDNFKIFFSIINFNSNSTWIMVKP